MRTLGLVGLCLLIAGCASDSDTTVVEKVLQDFGLQERPEGYVSGSDRVFAKLGSVARTELKRLNAENRHGEIKFDDTGGLVGWYYKEIKIYENYYPLEAMPSGRIDANRTRGFIGYLEYEYRIYQSQRVANRTLAAAEPANVATDVRERETYRYRFSSGGAWSGAKGERVRK